MIKQLAVYTTVLTDNNFLGLQGITCMHYRHIISFYQSAQSINGKAIVARFQCQLLPVNIPPVDIKYLQSGLFIPAGLNVYGGIAGNNRRIQVENFSAGAVCIES